MLSYNNKTVGINPTCTLLLSHNILWEILLVCKYIKIYKLTGKIVQINIKFDNMFPFQIISIYFCLDHIPLNLSYFM